MREIKFRGITSNGEFLYGDLVKYAISGGVGISVKKNGFSVSYYVDEETVGQFTGMKDKNDKEIYEGDLVKISKDVLDLWPSGMKVSELIVIEFLHHGWFPFSHGTPMPSDLQVIGNIHERKELFNQEGKLLIGFIS